jgi:two-component system copper resistance phosphate regulon response regulator CusR
MNPMRILIVEDDTATAAFYGESLKGAGYATRVARTAGEALVTLCEFSPQLVLLDIGLADSIDGFKALGNIRQQSQVRVVMVTGRGSPYDVARGLDLGADNYLVKPVGQIELLARVRAELRQAAQKDDELAQGVYRYGEVVIELSPGKGIVKRGTRRAVLGEVEYRVLARLLQRPEEVVGARELLRVGWLYDVAVPDETDRRMLESCLYRLRQKVDGGSRKVIFNIRSGGYYVDRPD